jgi:photosystem II stability/assembly factor-like uncharacterized protein
MKKTILTLLAAAYTVISTAQVWTDITPEVYLDHDYMDVTFRDDSTGFITSDKGHLFRTNDAGKDWFIQEKFESLIHKIHFFNQDTGVLACHKAFYRTEDGGETWQLRDTLPERQASGLYYGGIHDFTFVNDTLGFAYGSGYIPGLLIFKTEDGGISWQQKARIRENGLDELSYGIHFIDQDTGLIFCNNGFYAKTTNGGDTWTKNYYPDDYTFTTCFFLDSLHGYASVSFGKIMETFDGGNTWEQIYKSPYSEELLQVLYFFDTTHAVAISEYYFYKTTDGGNNWTVESLDDWNERDIRDMHAINDSTYIVVGDGDQIQKTTNDGDSWTRFIYGAPNGFDQLFFTSENTGYVNIGYGRVLKTNNGGEDWQIIEPGGNGTIVFTSPDTGYIGSFDTVYKTTDAGNTWKSVPVAIPAYDFLIFPSPDTGYAGTDHWGFMLKTYDAGESWDFITGFKTKIDGEIGSASFTSASTGYITGWEGRISRTFDAGNTWERADGPSDCNITDSYYINDSVGILVCENKILKTMDGNNSWDTLYRYNHKSSYLNEIYFRDSLNGIVTISFSSRDTVITTNDGGNIWKQEYGNLLFELYYVNRYIGYGAANTKIYKITYPRPVEIGALPDTLFAIPPGDSMAVTVPFSVQQAFNADNAFTAWLSSTDGTWESPLNIGILEADSGTSLQVTFPPGLEEGSCYRIRINASSPQETGSQTACFSITHDSLNTMSDAPAAPGSSLRLYPNPVVDELNASCSQPILSYTIYNTSGHSIIRQQSLHTQSLLINTSHLIPGPYLLKVTTSQGVLKKMFSVEK